MEYRKCPRCELNYIRDGEKLCGVCKNAVLTSCEPDEDDDLVVICSECGENRAMNGSMLCANCMRNLREPVLKGIDDTILFKDIGIGEMEKLEIPVDDSIPESELIEIDSELSSSEDEEL